MKEPEGSVSGEKQQMRHEVISGVDRGYIRSDPEKMKQLFIKSFTEAGVTTGHDEDTNTILQRAADISAHFGRTILKSDKRRNGIIENYDSLTTIRHDNHSLTIRIGGPIDASQLSDKAEIFESPVGNILPEPKADITFKTFYDDDTEVVYRFVYGRNGTTRFEQWTDDKEGFRVTEMTAEQATEYLMQNLPTTADNNGVEVLNKDTAPLPSQTIRSFFNDIRLARLDTDNTALQHRLEEKRKRYGADQVLYLPQDYFNSQSKEGELFAIDYPQTLIPEDIFAFSTIDERIGKIAEEMRIEVDDQTKINLEILLDGLPGGTCNIGVLIQKDNTPALPQMKRVPTTITDKVVRYFLQHPEKLHDSLAKYKKLWETRGKNPVTSDLIEFGLKASLLDRESNKYKNLFEHFATDDILNKNEIPDDIQEAITQSYASFVNLAAILKSEVYSQEDLEIISS